MTGGFPPYELIPGRRSQSKGIFETTNAFGMRDREYTREKPPGVYRIALLGASHTKGSGVADDATFENVVEDRLTASGLEVEILNFSAGGYGPLSRLAMLRDKALSFDPDAVVIVGVDEWEWVVTELANSNDKGHPLPFPELLRRLEDAGVEEGLPRIVAEQRLRPLDRELAAWVYREYAHIGRETGIPVYSVILPRPEQIDDEASLIREQQEMARDAGLTVLDLSTAYAGVDDLGSLWIAKWDRHPNEEGHRRLADALQRSLEPHLGVALASPGTVPPSSSTTPPATSTPPDREHQP